MAESVDPHYIPSTRICWTQETGVPRIFLSTQMKTPYGLGLRAMLVNSLIDLKIGRNTWTVDDEGERLDIPVAGLRGAIRVVNHTSKVIGPYLQDNSPFRIPTICEEIADSPLEAHNHPEDITLAPVSPLKAKGKIGVATQQLALPFVIVNSPTLRAFSYDELQIGEIFPEHLKNLNKLRARNVNLHGAGDFMKILVAKTKASLVAARLKPADSSLSVEDAVKYFVASNAASNGVIEGIQGNLLENILVNFGITRN